MIYDALDRVYERYVHDPEQWTIVVRAKEHLSKAASSAS